MTSKIILVLVVVIAAASAVPPPPPAPPAPQVNWPALGGANPWIPPWMSAMPWITQWTPCNAIGSSCIDCSTKLVCTKIGGLQKACTDPTLPYCSLGQCSATPSAECAPASAPASSTAAPGYVSPIIA